MVVWRVYEPKICCRFFSTLLALCFSHMKLLQFMTGLCVKLDEAMCCVSTVCFLCLFCFTYEILDYNYITSEGFQNNLTKVFTSMRQCVHKPQLCNRYLQSNYGPGYEDFKNNLRQFFYLNVTVCCYLQNYCPLLFYI